MRLLQLRTFVYTAVLLGLGFMGTQEETSTLHLQWRIDVRDTKLNCREEQLARHHPAGLRVCKCNICRGETKSLRRSAVVVEHLTRYGRAPFLRGSTKVRAQMKDFSSTEHDIHVFGRHLSPVLTSSNRLSREFPVTTRTMSGTMPLPEDTVGDTKKKKRWTQSIWMLT